MLDNLSNNDRTKWDFFLGMYLPEFLNTLAFYKAKQEREKQIYLKNKI